jgi:hypothetical protein
MSFSLLGLLVLGVLLVFAALAVSLLLFGRKRD